MGFSTYNRGSVTPMRCLAVCQDELVIRMLDEILLPGFEIEFIVDSRALLRRLHDAGVAVTFGDPRRTDTYLKADLTPGTCIIIEDNARRSLRKMLEAVRDAGGTHRFQHLPEAAARVVFDDDAGAGREIGFEIRIGPPRIAERHRHPGVVETPEQGPAVDDELDFEAGQQDF